LQRCTDILGQTPVQASGREHLRELLSRASGGVVITTIRKIMPKKGGAMPELSARQNIVVIADEAHREDVTDCDAAELIKKFLSLWDMRPMDWVIILREGQVNFSLLDQDLIVSTIAEGFKELGQPFDAENWMKNVSFRASA
jgi:hypothetical protein